ncbi:MAG: serine hydrolase [Deltaproteobacteria bacterium]|jgi:CubicO group peptidase (beta-lactamase class C family)|nr:serine hydrolase [Deltaproteobacteria bacterium]
MITARPEDVGLDGERLAHIDRHLAEHYVGPGKIPGAVTVVARRGEVVHASALGQRDRERALPMELDTLVRIYSMTKPITSVALMQLHEQARFKLSDPVHRFIPEWRDLAVYAQGRYPQFVTTPCQRPMTVRDLLSHTSGLTYGFMERTNVDSAYRRLAVGERKQGSTLRDMIETLADLPLEFSPGTAWNYSVATDVCGYLVETISGQPFDRYLEEHVFAPLGMTETSFQVREDQRERFAACYVRGPRKVLKLDDDPRDSPYIRNVTFHSGGGGLVSTAGDYLRFCQALLRGGELDGHRILGPRTLELMTRNHLPGGRDLSECSVAAFSETPYDGTGFGLGFSVILDAVRAQATGSEGAFAWGGAASTIFWIDPREELVVVFLTQLMPSRTFDFRGQLQALVYGAIVE